MYKLVLNETHLSLVLLAIIYLEIIQLSRAHLYFNDKLENAF